MALIPFPEPASTDDLRGLLLDYLDMPASSAPSSRLASAGEERRPSPRTAAATEETSDEAGPRPLEWSAHAHGPARVAPCS
ncbi:hypothetical protein N864_07895 [Intrasporangium chromatireducens Q5-1]|uniref:Uncharacterized protein n=1 Tax=Intrasporangium chromatireducens Q5-1 TaxID=584657 RepID=W9GU43_9MICO|nr:hypothetical protein N864_07895 [Intrasporangium chromatireducens Q5-1]